ncbi:YhfG family protein [Rugamonas sp. DEMB1]|uniref:YhfG family protein n=1 Tax=Rugamonas sp. DEMB1 TaxID=3039386 RepID=UPI00391C28F0
MKPHDPASWAGSPSRQNHTLQRPSSDALDRPIRYNLHGLTHLSRGSIDMLTNEMKRQVFLKLRAENYRASLRLEGLVPRTVGAGKPAAETTAAPPLETKHVR